MLRLCVLLLLTHTAFADAQTVTVDVQRQKGNVYQFTLQFTAQAPVRQVLALLTDYNQLTRLNPTIVSSRALPLRSAIYDRVEIVTRGCMLFFCKKVRRVEDVRIVNTFRIESIIVPELSDFKSGNTLWTFVPKGRTTEVNYQATMVPDFWLPPFIGPLSLKKQIRNQLQRSAQTINTLLTENKNQYNIKASWWEARCWHNSQ